MNPQGRNPEPVPPATQLAIMPFLAGVYGWLTLPGEVSRLRVTMHRAMTREGGGYLQQVSGYLPLSDDAKLRREVGRLFPVSEGLIGHVYKDRHIWRTKHSSSDDELRKNLIASGERDPDGVAKSYLAIPFLGDEEKVVLILYADCWERNFFADDSRVNAVASMCRGLCGMYDSLQKFPFPNLRNFPLPHGEPVAEEPTVYKYVHESLAIEPPGFESLSSFNYEASVA